MFGNRGLAFSQDEQGVLNVNIKGSIPTKVEDEVLLNAATVAAGTNSSNFTITKGDYHELYVAVAVDKQPWSLYGRTFFASTPATQVFYPQLNNIDKTSTIGNPILAFYNRSFSAFAVLSAPTSLAEAKSQSLPYVGGQDIVGYFRNNHPTDPATVTVRAIKVWRGSI